jgi:hypothetical protein
MCFSSIQFNSISFNTLSFSFKPFCCHCFLLLLIVRVNVHNLAQDANWRSLVKRLWSCSFKLIDDQNLLPLVKSINLKEGTRLQLQRRFYQTSPICSLRQTAHIYPRFPLCNKTPLSKSVGLILSLPLLTFTFVR